MKNFNRAPEADKVDKKIARGKRMAQHMAAASSMGYNMLGAAVITQPGVLPKVVAAGLALKGSGDYLRAYDMQPNIAQNARQRARQRFDNFTEKWADNDGTSLKDRMKRHVGKDLGEFKDKEFSTRFNRMMGGLAMGMAGVEINLSATSNAERVAGAAMAAYGIMDHTMNGQKAFERSTELQSQENSASQNNPAQAI